MNKLNSLNIEHCIVNYCGSIRAKIEWILLENPLHHQKHGLKALLYLISMISHIKNNKMYMKFCRNQEIFFVIFFSKISQIKSDFAEIASLVWEKLLALLMQNRFFFLKYQCYKLVQDYSSYFLHCMSFISGYFPSSKSRNFSSFAVYFPSFDVR